MLVFTCSGVFLLLCANRPSPDVPEGRLPPAKPVSVQSPGEGEEERGREWHRPSGECTTQDRERGTWGTDAGNHCFSNIIEGSNKTSWRKGFSGVRALQLIMHKWWGRGIDSKEQYLFCPHYVLFLGLFSPVDPTKRGSYSFLLFPNSTWAELIGPDWVEKWI